MFYNIRCFCCFIIAPGSCTFILHFSQVTKGKIVLFKYEFKGLKCLLFIRCWNVLILTMVELSLAIYGLDIMKMTVGVTCLGYFTLGFECILSVVIWTHTFCHTLNAYFLSYFKRILSVILWTDTFCHTLNGHFLSYFEGMFSVILWMHTFCHTLNAYTFCHTSNAHFLSYFERILSVILWTHTFCLKPHNIDQSLYSETISESRDRTRCSC